MIPRMKWILSVVLILTQQAALPLPPTLPPNGFYSVETLVRGGNPAK